MPRLNTSDGAGSGAAPNLGAPSPVREGTRRVQPPATGGGEPAQRYSDAKNDYVTEDRATGDSQSYRSNPQNIRNPQFQLFLDKPAGPVTGHTPTAQFSFNPSALHDSPPIGFKYKPWMSKHPQVAMAGLKSNLTPDDWNILDRHFRTEDATAKLMIAARISEKNPTQLAVTYAGLMPDVREGALKNLQDFADSQIKAAQNTSENPDAESKNYLQQLWDTNVWPKFEMAGAGIGAAFDFINHVKRYEYDASKGNVDKENPDHLFQWDSQRWAATEQDALDPKIMNDLTAKYGEKPTQMLLDINRAFADDPKDPWSNLLVKYGDDPEFFPMMNQYLLENQRDETYNGLQSGIDAASNGSLGNMIARDFLDPERANTAAYKAVSNVTEIAQQVVLDPTFLATKAITAARIAKYGLVVLASAEHGATAVAKAGITVDRMMKYRSVRKFWADMGADAKAYQSAVAAKDSRLADALMTRMRQREDRIFGNRMNGLQTSFAPIVETPEQVAMRRAFTGIETKGKNLGPTKPAKVGFEVGDYSRQTNLTREIIDNRLFTPERAAAWIKSGEGLDLILRGHSAMKYPLMPRYSWGSEALRLVMPASRGDGAVKVYTSKAGNGIIRSGINAGRVLFEHDPNPESLAKNLSENSEGIGKSVGQTGEYKKLIGRRLPVGVHLWGDTRQRGFVYAMKQQDNSAEAKIRRLTNLAKKAPINSLIEISDGRDAKAIAAFGRAIGFNKHHVNTLMNLWEEAIPAQRRIIAQGMANTLLHAHGIDASDPEVFKHFGMKLVDGINPTSQFGTRVPWADVSMSQEQARSILTGERLRLQGGDMTLEQRQKYLKHIIWVQANAQRQAYFELKRLRTEIKSVTSSSRMSARLKTLQDQEAHLKEVIATGGDDLSELIRSNGLEGIKSAQELGLEITSRALKVSKDAAKETGAAIRDTSIANTAARDAVDATARAARNSANKTRDIPTVADTRAVIRENADQSQVVKSYIEDANQANKKLSVDAQAAANQSRKEVYAASDVHRDLLTETLEEAKNTQEELLNVQQEIKKLTSTGRGMQAQDLMDQAEVLKDRLTMLEDAAKSARWRLGNLQTEEQYTRDLAASTSTFSTYDPSVIDGVAHALHIRQTAKKIRMPDFAKIQQIAGRTGLMDAMLGMSFTNWATNLVDTWSLLTLAGFRFAIRNGIEDFIFHDLSGGDIGTTIKGRKASNSYLIASGKRPALLHEITDAKWRPYVSKDEISEAIKLRKDGDRKPFAELVARGMIRGKLQTLGIFPDALAAEHIDQLIAGGFADRILSEIAESAVNVEKNAGRGVGNYFDHLADEPPAGSLDTTKFRGANTEPLFRNLPLTDQSGHDAWWVAINDFAHRDGALGRKALWAVWELARNPAGSPRTLLKGELAKELAKTIRENGDKPWSYKNVLSGIEASSPENFAARYLDEAITIFSGSNGINEPLVAKLIGKKPEYGIGGVIRYVDDPERKGTALWDMVDGVKHYRVSPNDLLDYPTGLKPTSVVGAEQIPIPDPSAWESNTSKVWGLMGDQYNRIAKQPMFFANYLQQRSLLKDYEAMLTEQFGAGVAADTTAKLAADRAFEKLMAYTDNPSNRSLLAWNTRNLARYYRATEDFYRRTARAVRFNPDRVVRDALLLHAMNDAGFVHTDDQGNKYFMYPNVFPAFNSLMKIIGVPFSVPTGNIGFKGQFNMLTPSADPASWLPTFSGPLIAAPISAIAQVWKPFEEIQRLTLGEASMGRSTMEMLLPPPVQLMFNYVNKDENTGKFANNLRNVIYGAAANGDIPDPNADQNIMDNWIADKKMQAESVTMLQAFLRFAAPASPNTVPDAPTSDQFASSGVGSLRQAFLDMVSAYRKNGSQDPFKDAVNSWQKINPSLSFWEVPKSKDNSTAVTTITSAGADWIKQNADIVRDKPEAAGYLIPKEGQYDPQSLRIFKAYGVKVPDELHHFATRVAVINQLNTYYRVRDNYRQARAAETSPTEQKKMDQKFKNWKNGWDDDQGVHHQGFMDQLPGYKNNVLLSLFMNTSDSQEIKKSTLEALSNEDPNKLGVLQIIKKNRPEQWAADPTLQTIQDMINNFNNAKIALSKITGRTKQDKAAKDDIKFKVSTWLEKHAGSDQRALELYRSLMEPDLTVGGAP
jgi:hypothetical protein